MVDRRHVLLAAGTGMIGLAGAGWSGLRRMGSMAEYSADLAPLRAALTADPDPRDLVRFATLAANNSKRGSFKSKMAGSASCPTSHARRQS